MGEFAKSYAGPTSIVGTVLGGVALANSMGGNCNNGGLLGGLFGGNNNCHVTKDEFAFALANQKEMAQKDAEIAFYKGQDITKDNIIATYKELKGDIIQRDGVIAGLAQEAAVNREKINCLEGKVENLQSITAAQNVELADGRVREAELNGRVNTLALTTRERSDAMEKQFNAALQANYDWTDCNFVRNEKVIPADKICPAPVTCRDVQNYFLAGNTAQTPAATGGTCCQSGSCGSNLNKK